MKVLFAHDHIFYKFDNKYFSNGGLSGQVLSRYTNVFDSLSILSRQVTLQELDENLSYASIKNTNFINVPNFKSLKKIKNIKPAKEIIYQAVMECDCLIARLPSTIGEIAVKYAKALNKPYLIEVVGCAWDANLNYGSISGKVYAPFEWFLNKKLIKKAPYVIYITKEFLQGRYPTSGKNTICPNVNINPVNSIVLSNKKKRINNQPTQLKFGLIGSLDVDYKGHDTVIKAFGLLKKEFPNFKIEFLGKGDSKRWSDVIKKNGLMENIEFIGTLPSGKSVYEWMDKIDIILQPSYAEAQGRSIIESMSRGCPIISSNVGGIVELIDNNWLIEAGDYQDLSKKIKQMILNSKLQTEQSEKNFQEATHYYKDKIEKKREKFLIDFRDNNTI